MWLLKIFGIKEKVGKDFSISGKDRVVNELRTKRYLNDLKDRLMNVDVNYKEKQITIKDFNNLLAKSSFNNEKDLNTAVKEKIEVYKKASGEYTFATIEKMFIQSVLVYFNTMEDVGLESMDVVSIKNNLGITYFNSIYYIEDLLSGEWIAKAAKELKLSNIEAIYLVSKLFMLLIKENLLQVVPWYVKDDLVVSILTPLTDRYCVYNSSVFMNILDKDYGKVFLNILS